MVISITVLNVFSLALSFHLLQLKPTHLNGRIVIYMTLVYAKLM